MPTGKARPNRNIAWAKSPSRTEAVDSGWLSLVDHSIDAAAVAEAPVEPPLRGILSW